VPGAAAAATAAAAADANGNIVENVKGLEFSGSCVAPLLASFELLTRYARMHELITAVLLRNSNLEWDLSAKPTHTHAIRSRCDTPQVERLHNPRCLRQNR
jgi:hypothetical protein